MVQGSKHKPPIDMSQKHTIEEVLVEVVKAQQLYSQVDDQSGHWRRVRLKLKGIIGNHNPAYESWLNLLPKESHYLSIVWGGMKLIIGVSLSYSTTIRVAHGNRLLRGFRRSMPR